jgi:hypothetical protein
VPIAYFDLLGEHFAVHLSENFYDDIYDDDLTSHSLEAFGRSAAEDEQSARDLCHFLGVDQAHWTEITIALWHWCAATKKRHARSLVKNLDVNWLLRQTRRAGRWHVPIVFALYVQAHKLNFFTPTLLALLAPHLRKNLSSFEQTCLTIYIGLGTSVLTNVKRIKHHVSRGVIVHFKTGLFTPRFTAVLADSQNKTCGIPNTAALAASLLSAHGVQLAVRAAHLLAKTHDCAMAPSVAAGRLRVPLQMLLDVCCLYPLSFSVSDDHNLLVLNRELVSFYSAASLAAFFKSHVFEPTSICEKNTLDSLVQQTAIAVAGSDGASSAMRMPRALKHVHAEIWDHYIKGADSATTIVEAWPVCTTDFAFLTKLAREPISIETFMEQALYILAHRSTLTVNHLHIYQLYMACRVTQSAVYV